MPRLGFWMLGCVGLCLAWACATPVHTSAPEDDTLVSMACSRFSPSMQTAILEAVVAAGGPQQVTVEGWMCGRQDYGYVRIVMLKRRDAAEGDPLIPVIFESGRLVSQGWDLLEKQPNRYGESPGPDREHPWRHPDSWCDVVYGSEPL